MRMLVPHRAHRAGRASVEEELVAARLECRAAAASVLLSCVLASERKTVAVLILLDIVVLAHDPRRCGQRVDAAALRIGFQALAGGGVDRLILPALSKARHTFAPCRGSASCTPTCGERAWPQ